MNSPIDRSSHPPTLLVAGGTRDPNVLAVFEAARHREIDVVPLLVGEGEAPSLRWDLESDELWLDDRRIDATAVFMRRDVFHEGGRSGGYRSIAWWTALQGWLAVAADVRTLNRGYLGRYTNKLHALRLARHAGLYVPPTLVTNDLGRLTKQNGSVARIAKPVSGGGYCMALDELMAGTELREGIAAAPAIVQPRMPGTDLRIFVVAGRAIAFRITTPALDYRTSSERTIEPVDDVPGATVDALIRLMNAMGLDWGAADFKVDPESGDLAFLEINSDPMFSAFDRVANDRSTNHRVADTIVTALCG